MVAMVTILFTVYCKLFHMMPYIIILKVRKFHQTTASRFSTARKKPVGGGTLCPPPPSLNRVKLFYHGMFVDRLICQISWDNFILVQWFVHWTFSHSDTQSRIATYEQKSITLAQTDTALHLPLKSVWSMLDWVLIGTFHQWSERRTNQERLWQDDDYNSTIIF